MDHEMINKHFWLPFMNRFFCFFTSLLISNLLLVANEQSDKRPNILFIMVDDLGYGDLSCYGAPDLHSPHLDKLFAAGIRFNQFYANCPVCSPTRASFLTGLYPDNAGVPGVIRTRIPGRVTNWGNLRNDVKTLPSHLKEAGYDTALIGKWHLGLEKPDRPVDVGFDYFEGFLGDMMDDYYRHTRHGFHYMYQNETPIRPAGHATDLFSDWTINYIKQRKHKDNPFFAFLAYNAPHTPIQPPEDWTAKVVKREPGIGEKRAKLVALIEHMDAGIGRVLESLKTEGLDKNTIVVFTSDNGGQVNVMGRNAPLRGGKQEMWEGGLRVCTCIVWPDKIKPNQVNNEHVSLTMDFYPTLADLVAHPVKHSMDGRSFAPILLGEDWQPPERDLFWVRLEGNRKYGGIPYHAVRRGDWKLLRNTGFEPYQLFNLAKDPTESTPLSRGQEPKIYDQLFNSLMSHINQAGQHKWQ